jgi:predicted permease
MAQYLSRGDTEWKDGQWARGSWWMKTVARVAEGTGVEAAEDQATALHRNGRREEIEAGRYEADVRVTLRDLIAARGEDASAESRVARWLGAVSLIVLLIACANVANLLLARSTRRRREVAVRLALGVSRARLVGLIMVEALVLAVAGGALALVLARWGGSVLRRGLLPDVFFPDAAVDGRVVAFTVAASLLAGLLAGIGPAFQSTRVDVSHDLAEAGRGGSGRRSRTRSALVVAQATFSLVLLVGAGLFVRSLRQVHAVDLGLDADRVVLASLELVDDGMDLAEQNRLYERAVQRLRAVPGVQNAAATASPFGWGFASGLSVPDVDSIPRLPGGGPYFFTVTPDYFATLGLEIQLGRGILESDGPGDRMVAVISRTMAESLWPGEAPLGRCLRVGTGAEACTDVVGVVEDASRGSLETDPYMAYYLPATQAAAMLGDHFAARLNGIYVRAAGDADALTGAAAEALRGFSPDVRYATARTLRDILDPQARSWTLGATMFSIFGLLALLVASVGLYSVLSFEVAQRTREIGIRSALGAGRSALLRGVVVEGLRLIVLGVVIGLGAAWLLAPRVGDLLFEVSPRDPAVMSLVAVVLLGAASLAGLVPGLRATRVDPARALRSE